MHPPHEPHSHGHHRTGIRWLDLALPGAALFISLVSVAIAVHHGHTMEKLVAANSWPFLQIRNSDVDLEHHAQVLSFTVTNAGVGPAHVDEFSVELDGHPVRNEAELVAALRRCCGADEKFAAALAAQANAGPRAGTMVTGSVAGTIIPAKGEVTVFSWVRTPEFAAVWDALAAARGRARFTACYCSVFDECWTTAFDGRRPRETATCHATGG